MQLLTWNSQNELSLTDDLEANIPSYAILSHTWGPKCDEVTFADIQKGQGQNKLGYAKIRFCGEQAKKDGINHFWVDTCCINKDNQNELSKAITSMFRWYENAQKCYVYLSDVQAEGASGNLGQTLWEPSFRTSRYFTRGWTLQELLAPKVIEFFSKEWCSLGTKQTLAQLIHEITTLPLAALHGTPLTQFSIDERIRWTEGRQTTVIEDRAYCLLGIFKVFIPLNYGEGDYAFHRLREEVNKFHGWNVATRLGVIDETRSLGNHKQQSGQASQHNSTMIDKDTYNKLLKSLLFDRIDFRVNNAKKGLISTCQWLFRHPDFQSWHENNRLTQHSGFLWIKGKPGCGKSTLMKAVLEWARKQKGKNCSWETVTPYFFNARAAASLEKSSLGLYRTVVYHLLSSYLDLQALFTKKFALKNPGEMEDNWTVEELQEFLYDTIESNTSFRLCLLIDALDEAEYEDDVRQMISFLVQLSDRALAPGCSCKLHICLSSRHYPRISIPRGLSLVVEDQVEHDEDIDCYITKELISQDGPEKSDLRAEILNKSSGIFLWVVLVVNILNTLEDRGATLLDMKARLKTIPAGLDELFRETLIKSDEGIETSILFFQWMAFSMRPLEPAEIFAAMEYSKSLFDQMHTLTREISVPAPDRLARFVLNCSRGLVEIVDNHTSKAATVQFIHETVREFLLGENGLASISAVLATNVAGISHEILRIACLRCISMNDIPKECEPLSKADLELDTTDMGKLRSGIRLRLPFLDYAILHLFDHAEQAQRYGISQLTFLKDQMDVNGVWLDSHRLWWNILQQFKSKKAISRAPLVYFVAEQQYSNLLPVLLRISNTIDTTCGEYRSVLKMSSYHDSREMVQIPPDHSININSQGGDYGNALQAASMHGNEKIVQILLDHGADVNAQGGHYGNALYAASGSGHEKIVQILLDHGANSNAQGGYYGNALQVASMYSHEKIVQILLNYGADVNAQGGYYGNALQAASMHGNEKMVQILLDHGADVNAQGGPYGNALQAASMHGYEKIVQILLDYGANINAQGSHYGNVLQIACINGHEKIVQILLDHGADINIQGGHYDTVLQAASARGDGKIVQILLDHGTDIDAQGGRYDNALQAASVHGHEKIVQILQKHKQKVAT